MAFGFHGAILHVYLDTQTTSVEYPEDNFYRIYGGGGLLPRLELQLLCAGRSGEFGTPG
jgi:hypothetical protein